MCEGEGYTTPPLQSLTQPPEKVGHVTFHHTCQIHHQYPPYEGRGVGKEITFISNTIGL